jgi:TFIIF-interacting CTD phosphatase-like protein
MAKKEGMIEGKETTPVSNSSDRINVEKVMMENFVALQKVMTNLVLKLDSLSSQISQLLELFEISAKTLAEKGYSADNKNILDKLNNLIEQNKAIAKGLVLLHEKVNPANEEQEEVPMEENTEDMQPSIISRPQPQQMGNKPMGNQQQSTQQFPRNQQMRNMGG